MPNEIDFRQILASLLDTRGRLSRGGFWLAYSAMFGFALVTLPFVVLLRAHPGFALLLWSPMMVLLLLATIRRLHDRGKGGWSLLAVYGPMLSIMLLVGVFQILPGEGVLGYVVGVLAAIAMVATIWVTVQIFMLPGMSGPNRFGPDPLHSEGGGALNRAIAFLAPR